MDLVEILLLENTQHSCRLYLNLVISLVSIRFCVSQYGLNLAGRCQVDSRKGLVENTPPLGYPITVDLLVGQPVYFRSLTTLRDSESEI